MRYQENEIDYAKFDEALEVIIDQVKNYRDPVELKYLYKQFKKIVPFSLRSYVIGFIVKNIVCSGRFRARNEHARTREAEPRNQFDDSIAITLFIGIGRNRHVYARDIVGILTHVANIDRDHIGSIRILDNYSFVQVLKQDATDVIEKLNGHMYRGRKLSVSYSRKNETSETFKEQESDTMTATGDENGYTDSTESVDSTEA